jgi:hypothetical protein
MHGACSGGHSELIVRAKSTRQIRLTYLRPYDRWGDPKKDVPAGFVFGAMSIDERANADAPWEKFKGFSLNDVFADDWSDEGVARANNCGRCIAAECFQHGHGGGWQYGQPTRQLKIGESIY